MTSLHNDSDESKRVLAELVEELADRLASDEPFDVDVWIAGHAEHADDLRRLLPAARMMAELGRSADANTRSSPSASQILDSIDGTLGDFKIGRELGRGGMGVVYEARQISLSRRVALKILPFAAVVDPRQVARFKNEAQAAGQLDHANIVDVIAVGCERGVHYYAMRFIDGVTLAEVIEELRCHREPQASGGRQPPGSVASPLGAVSNDAGGRSQESGARSQDDDGELQIGAADAGLASNPKSAIRNPKFSTTTTTAVAAFSTDRATNRKSFFRSIAELAIPVAEALDHAHEVGVIHRDVKPSNLMLDGRGKIWLTDFGLARISSAHEMTVTGDLLGTLRYMSPEQALAKRVIIDHRTDIYSLGATLYELLTLQPVFRGHEKQELLRQIAFEDPRALRRLDRAVPPELETIVLKALEKNPADRYSTAKDLADDLRRFLDEKPIHARRPGMRQRAVKWGRRHTSAVTAAVCVLSISVVALVLSTYRIGIALQTARDAVTAEKKALVAATQAAELENKARLAEEAKGRQAAAVTELLESAFTRLDPAAEQKGGPSIVEQLVSQLDEIAETLEKDYAGEPLVRARLRNALGKARLGLGEAATAVELYEKAHAEYMAQLGPDHPDTLNVAINLATSYLHVGQFDMALRLFETTLEARRVTLGPDHPDSLTAAHNLAGAFQAIGRLDEAIGLYETTLEGHRVKKGPDHQDTLATMNNLAGAYRDAGRLDEALPLFEEALAKMEEKFGRDHPDTLKTIGNLARVYLDAGRFGEAMPLNEEVLAKLEDKLGRDHPDTLTSMDNLAGVYLDAGRFGEAMPLYEEVLAKVEDKLGRDHPDTLITMGNLAGVYLDAGRFGEAVQLYEEALAKQEEKLGRDHPDTLNTINNLAEAYMRTARFGEALPLYEEALAKLEDKLGRDHPRTLRTMANLASAYIETNRLEEAVPLCEEAFAKQEEKLGRDHPVTLNTMGILVHAYSDANRLEETLPLAEEALATTRQKLGPDHRETFYAMDRLANVYRRAGRFDDALPPFENALGLGTAKLGPDHYETLVAMNHLAHFHWSMKKLNLSIPLFEQSLALTTAKLGESHVDTLLTSANLGVNYRDAGRVAEAIELMEKAIKLATADAKPLPPALDFVRQELAAAYVQAGEFAKAEPLLREFLDEARKQFGDDDPRTIGQMAALSHCLLHQQEYTGAESLARQCLAIREQTQPDVWTTFNTRSTLGGALSGQGNYAEAEPLLVSGFEGMNEREATIPPQHRVRLSEALERLVHLYEAWNKPDEAAQ